MNNKNKILVGCLALLLVLSVGYALFSETITINGTATAKGNFDLTTTCQVGDPYNFRPYDIQSGYTNDECNVVDNKVSYKANLTMPGAQRYFTITIKNTGTIPAIITDGKKSDKVCYDTDRDDVIETTDNCSTTDGNFHDAPDFIGFIKTDGTFLNGEDDDISDFINEDGAIVIQPNESAVVWAYFYWNPSLGYEYNNMLISLEASSEFTFTQATN